MTFAARTGEPLVPSVEDAKVASEASRILAAYVSQGQVNIELDDGKHERIHAILPSSVIKILQRVLTEMAQGNAVTIIPLNAELTTQQAADFLNVSRPFLVKQIEAGNIPHRKIGTHRRVRVEELLKYKKEIDKNRHQTLDELTAEAQRLGLGY